MSGCAYCGVGGHDINDHGDSPWRDEEVLDHLHNKGGWTTREMGDEFGCSKTTVQRWMKRLDVERSEPGRGDSDDPWRDESTIREMYCGEELTTYDIAEKLGCSQVTISNKLEEFGIASRPSKVEENNQVCRDTETLRSLYHDDGLSIREIATHLDVDSNVVRYWLVEHGIERRDSSEAIRSNHAPFSVDSQGYERWRVAGFGHDSTVRVHRLLAIAEGEEPGNVFSGDYHVHHKNGVKWDNRPDNVELLTRSDHARVHAKQRFGGEA